MPRHGDCGPSLIVKKTVAASFRTSCPVPIPPSKQLQELDTDEAEQNTKFFFHGHVLLPSQLQADFLIQFFIQMLVCQHFHGKDTSEM